MNRLNPLNWPRLRRLAMLGLCGAACGLTQAQSALPEAVQEALRQAQIPEASLGAVVLPLSGQAPALSHRAQAAMAPASTLKLLTTVVALDELGPTFRWRTQLLATGAIKGASLRGPLYLRGGGDPNLSWQQLQLMLRALRAQGVRQWRGDLVLDRSYFAPERPDLGVADFDESPDAYYNVIPDALLLNSNLLELDLSSDAQRVQVRLRTPIEGVQLRSRQTLVDADCKDWDEGWLAPEVKARPHAQLQLTLRGTFPRGCEVSASSNVLARNVFVERVLRALWRELGGSWSGHVVDGRTPPDARLLVEQASDTLADSVKRINKRSDNAMARSLYLTLGAQAANTGAQGNHLETANARTRGWLSRHGIASDGLVLDNGSGLSRLERVTPQQLAQLLQAAAHSPWFAELATSLPIVALDGGMRRRLVGTGAALRSRIKTGTLRDAAAVAGYVRDSAGQDWVVVAIVNDPLSKHARPALDALIEWVASGAGRTAFASAPPPAPAATHPSLARSIP